MCVLWRVKVVGGMQNMQVGYIIWGLKYMPLLFKPIQYYASYTALFSHSISSSSRSYFIGTWSINPWAAMVTHMGEGVEKLVLLQLHPTSQQSLLSSMSAVLLQVSCDSEYYLCGQREVREGGLATAFQHQGSFYYCCDSCNAHNHRERGIITNLSSQSRPARIL